MSRLEAQKTIKEIVLGFYPACQAIYLFGSYGTENEWASSDIDIAVLLPYLAAKQAGPLGISECNLALANHFSRSIDLINIRSVSTVFQNEIISTGKPIFCADDEARLEFEVNVLSQYANLNEERKDILLSFAETGRAYKV